MSTSKGTHPHLLAISGSVGSSKADSTKTPSEHPEVNNDCDCHICSGLSRSQKLLLSEYNEWSPYEYHTLTKQDEEDTSRISEHIEKIANLEAKLATTSNGSDNGTLETDHGNKGNKAERARQKTEDEDIENDEDDENNIYNPSHVKQIGDVAKVVTEMTRNEIKEREKLGRGIVYPIKALTEYQASDVAFELVNFTTAKTFVARKIQCQGRCQMVKALNEFAKEERVLGTAFCKECAATSFRLEVVLTRSVNGEVESINLSGPSLKAVRTDADVLKFLQSLSAVTICHPKFSDADGNGESVKISGRSVNGTRNLAGFKSDILSSFPVVYSDSIDYTEETKMAAYPDLEIMLINERNISRVTRAQIAEQINVGERRIMGLIILLVSVFLFMAVLGLFIKLCYDTLAD